MEIFDIGFLSVVYPALIRVSDPSSYLGQREEKHPNKKCTMANFNSYLKL